MQKGRRRLIWAYVFFGCAAVSTLLGYWGLLRSGTAPASTLGRGLVVSALMLAAYVTMTLRVVRELRDTAAPRIQAQIVMGAGVGLFLVWTALTLR